MESLVHSVEGECEAYHQKGIHTKVVITNHRIASIEKKHVRGTGFRVFVNDCQGFAYTTDENRLEEAANLALKLAKSSTEVRKFPVPEECGKVEGLSDPGLKAVDVESISEMVQTMLSGAAEGGGRAVYGSVEITELHHEIVTSYGIAGNFEETSCYAGIDVEVDGYFGTETLYTRNSDINFFDVGKRAADLAAASKNPQNIKGGIMPVILRPPAVGTLFEQALVPSLLADNVDNGTSLFRDKVGERVSSDITVWDDGTLPGGIGSRPFDGEGSPCRKTIVIEKGVLKSFLHDSTTAFRHHVKSTGNAVRSSFSTPPTVYISNLMLNPEFETDELIENTKNGIVVSDIVGSFSFEFATGKFGFDARNVFLVRDGEIKCPVNDATITGDICDVLQSIKPGDDLKQEGLLLVPSVKMNALIFI